MSRISKGLMISGGTGFVGSAIVRALAEKHPDADHVLPSGIAYLQVDITSHESLKKAFETVNPDVVVHTAGIIPGLAERFRRRLEAEVWKVNVEGTRNMLDECKRANVEAFVYTSSCCVVTDDTLNSYLNIDEGWPSSPKSTIYGESKAAAEALVLKASSSSMATCALRPSVLCGPGDCQLVPAIHACIANRETSFLIGDGFNMWDITHVDNVADAHVLAIENLLSSRTAAGEAFFIQNNEPITFRDFCLAVWAQFGHFPPFEVRIPETMAYMVGLACETVTWVMGTTATLSRGSVRDACAVRYASGDKARKILGYQARIGIEEAIRLSCESYSRSQDYASRLVNSRNQIINVTGKTDGPL
ncbi:hypothetical protein N7452_004487 [Penicillium brevicompactum]|uniref:Ketoreductase domain-containing protein n=1 Tax=Penicillium brevicompactum TaxID=5074 RepID=A0A9W9UES9_PENBR|nr:hypothetical protein N7452_004487 [Penicillium brevicompactum]